MYFIYYSTQVLLFLQSYTTTLINKTKLVIHLHVKNMYQLCNKTNFILLNHIHEQSKIMNGLFYLSKFYLFNMTL